MIRSQIMGACGVLCLYVAGCAVPSAVDKDAPMQPPSPDQMVLGPGDIIKLTVYGEEVLSKEYTVDAAGNIAVPLIGDTKAAGVTRKDLQQHITGELVSQGYLTSPRVNVDMVSLRPVYILGEVRNPGTYPWHSGFTVFKAVASAGGYTPRAAKGRVIIERMQDGRVEQLNGTESTPLMPGDGITVRERIF